MVIENSRSEATAEIIRVALQVHKDGEQGVADILVRTQQEADNLFKLAKDTIKKYNSENSQKIIDVNPWIWNKKTTNSKAMSNSGEETGYELRLSRGKA